MTLGRRDSSWLWLLALFTVASLLESFVFSQVATFMPLYLPDLGVAEADVPELTGRIVAVSTAIGVPFAPLWGALADRFSRHPLIVRSFVAHTLGLVLMLAAGNVWAFAAGRAVTSLSIGNSGLMVATLAERVPRHRTALAISIMTGALPLGGFVGPLLGGPIVDAWGFRALLGVDVAVMSLVSLAMTFGYRDTFASSSRGPVLGMVGGSVGVIWRSPLLRALFPAIFLLLAGPALARIYMPLVVTDLYHGDDPGTAVGLVAGAGGLTTLALSPLMGALADRFGLRRMLLAGALVEMALWPLALLTQGLLGFAIFWAVVSGVVSGVMSVSFSLLSQSAPGEVRGRVMALSTLPMILGSVAGPAIGSVVTRGGLFNIFPTAAVITALGVAVLVLAIRQGAARAVQPGPTSPL